MPINFFKGHKVDLLNVHRDLRQIDLDLLIIPLPGSRQVISQMLDRPGHVLEVPIIDDIGIVLQFAALEHDHRCIAVDGLGFLCKQTAFLPHLIPTEAHQYF